jgi:predicted KAP-like P-loop ATPase
LSTLLSNASEEFVLFRPLLQKFETSKMDQEEFATAKKKILAGMEPIEAMVRDPFPQHVQTLSLPPEELENLDSSEPF